ncbi:pentapeptide repeat-containing protein [Dongia deserti]|uniref:pentapeptide repeat-containing protein n=1 Tax=Dongia deserti TaxID=2268030 RepID=UPI000E653E6D|nr:pentapeptide repeat-containing protein [Dongia deserti]
MNNLLAEMVCCYRFRQRSFELLRIAHHGPLTNEIHRFFSDEVRLRFNGWRNARNQLEGQVVPLVNWVLKNGMPVHRVLSAADETPFVVYDRAERRATDVLWAFFQDLADQSFQAGSFRKQTAGGWQSGPVSLQWPAISSFSSLLFRLCDHTHAANTGRIATFNYLDLRNQDVSALNNRTILSLRSPRSSSPTMWLELSLGAVNLSGTRLFSASLQGVNLARSDLSGARLGRSDLSGASLEESDLREADLTLAKLESANLIKADLSGANLSGAWIAGARLNHAKLAKCRFSPSFLVLVTFRMSDVSRVAYFRRTDLRSADLRNADLSECDFKNCILHNAFLSAANLSNSNLALASTTKTHFSDANIAGAQIPKSTLSSANFSESQIAQALILDESAVEEQRKQLRKSMNDEIERFPLRNVSVLTISDEEVFA